ncbi:mechanosensitive ion channel [Lentisphaera profundi]|uniref:Mechanosensitive ion channel n=1 Tax=Lentisphaera profundi TaxID=1658616 RepID=A0ABY7VYQ9_9BACT|nr:mechanosensitive ion channel domain-containing protein [Lentisphaera profundi]WDE98335.1 mechanosensitive ion channel [Lentisphaera profundi]
MAPLPNNPSKQLEKGMEIFDSSLIWLIIGAIGIVIASVLFSYIINRTLVKRLAKQMKMDRGIEFAIQKVSQYIFVSIGVYTAFAFVGLPVSAFAGVFALLSVGIGFGLQNITGNFISGIILLIERPIKVGDRITVGEVWGDVSRINLRTTIIQTFDNMSIIVPNSKILDDEIINWTFGDPRIRIKIPVGVAYGSDIRLVEKALMEAAEKHNHLLKKPAPQVWLNEFGDSSLNFQLIVWLEKAGERDHIVSDVNKIIYKLFLDYNIEIPFPQRDLNIKHPELLNFNQSSNTINKEPTGPI